MIVHFYRQIILHIVCFYDELGGDIIIFSERNNRGGMKPIQAIYWLAGPCVDSWETCQWDPQQVE
jgi:hypothetical protein